MLPGKVEEAAYTTICRVRDPDDNLVVLAQPHDLPLIVTGEGLGA
jgi:hypothetical protein